MLGTRTRTVKAKNELIKERWRRIGKIAFTLGKELRHCPAQPTSLRGRAWQEGWAQASLTAAMRKVAQRESDDD